MLLNGCMNGCYPPATPLLSAQSPSGYVSGPAAMGDVSPATVYPAISPWQRRAMRRHAMMLLLLVAALMTAAYFYGKQK